MATIETRKTQIKTTFRNHQVILDWPVSIEPIESRGKNVSVIYVPRPRDFNIDNPSAGVPLKEGVGFLSLKEEVDNEGNVLGYLYRFTSDEYTYIADKKNHGVDDWIGFFNFHYQNDRQHDEPHVSFLHSGIRYISRKIDLNEFLDFIERTFFVSGSRKNSLPWHSHFN